MFGLTVHCAVHLEKAAPYVFICVRNRRKPVNVLLQAHLVCSSRVRVK